MKEIYRSVDEVDTMVGLFAETPPEGFGFSDTAFRIFILMASRRLQSDRFLTVDFRPEIYSPFGMDWIANNGMTSIILRHCPDLAGRPAPRRRARSPRGGRSSRGGPRRPTTERSERGPSMTDTTTKLGHAGLDALAERPLLTSIWRRRTHRVSRGSSHRGRLDELDIARAAHAR